MLKTRIITAAILIPLVVAAVFYLPLPGFSLVIGGVLMVAAWEWSNLAGLGHVGVRVGYIAIVALLIAAAWYLLQIDQPLNGLVSLVAIAWLIGFTRLIYYRGGGAVPGFKPWVGLAGLFVLPATWQAMVNIRLIPGDGAALVMTLLLIVWVADTAAYFSGRRWGQRKLAPYLSPGKTWEGVIGAVIAVAVLALGLGLMFELLGLDLLNFVMLALATFVFSVGGDLAESLLKRRRGIKDSGQLLPGHGGMLDRIDSLLAASPVYSVGLGWVYA